MRVNRSLLGWGLFFIVLGAVPLAVRAGIVDDDLVGRAWTLWPLLLILGGLGLVLRRTPIEPLAGLATAATFGLIIGGFIAAGGVPVGACGDGGGGRPFDARSGPLASTASVEVELSCGELTLRAAEGSTWRVEGSGDNGRAPRLDASDASLALRSAASGPFGGAGDRWTVTLPAAARLSLEAQVNAGRGTLDLAGASLDRLQVQANAAEMTVDLRDVTALGRLDVQANAASVRLLLPSVGTSGELQGNLASVRVCRPSGVELRVTFEGVLASNDFSGSGLVERAGGWETPGYGSASERIDLRAQANLGSIELEAEGACGA